MDLIVLNLVYGEGLKYDVINRLENYLKLHVTHNYIPHTSYSLR